MTDFKRVFVDTAPIIYYLENSPLYSEVIKRFPLYDNGRFEITNKAPTERDISFRWCYF